MESDSIPFPRVIPQVILEVIPHLELPGRSGLVLRLEGSSPRQGVFVNAMYNFILYTSRKGRRNSYTPPKRHGMSVLHARKESPPYFLLICAGYNCTLVQLWKTLVAKELNTVPLKDAIPFL